MSVIELRCTSCNGPLDASLGPLLECGYCGAALLIQVHSGGAPTETLYTVTVGRVGPSNRARVAAALLDCVGGDAQRAVALVDGTSTEVLEWTEVPRMPPRTQGCSALI